MASPVRSGKLNRRVQLQKPDFTRSRGGAITTYNTVATVWAAVEPLRGQEFFESQKHTDKTIIRIRIRFRNDIRPDWRIQLDDTSTSPATVRKFRVVALVVPFDGRQEIHLMVEEFPSGEVA